MATKSLSVPKKMQDKYEHITALTDGFCAEYLNEEYAQACRELTATLCRKRPSPLETGRVQNWAGGIVHTLCTVNFGFDKTLTPHTTATDISDYFGVGKSSPGAKSKVIRDLLNIGLMEPEWTLPSRMDQNLLAWFISYNGLIIDARSAPRFIQEAAYAKGLIPYIPGEKS